MNNRILFIAILFSSQLSLALESPKSFQKMTVHAEKIHKNYSQASSFVHSISSEEIERFQGQSLSDLLAHQPGIIVNSTGAFGKSSKVSIRGANGGQVQLIVDGVEMGDPMNNTRSSAIEHISLDNIEKVEILKGPQSVLYGSDSLAGVIVVTTKEGTENIHNEFNFGVGSYNTQKYIIATRGKSKLTTYALSNEYLETDGISAFNEKNELNITDEEDGYRRNTFTGKVSLDITKKSKISVQTRMTNSSFQFDGWNQDSYEETGEFDQNSLELSYSHRLLDDLFESEASFSKGRTDREDFHGRTEKFESVNRFYLSEHHSLVLGIELEKDIGEISDEMPNSALKSNSAYLSHFIEWKNFFSTQGLRHDHNYVFGNHLSSQFGLGYRLPWDFILKGNYATGFKAPTLYQLYHPRFNGDDLEPVKSESIEIGMQLNKKWGSYNATLYKTNYKNMIDMINFVWVPGGKSTGDYVNIKKSIIKGYEFSGKNQLGTDTELNYSYTRLQALDKISRVHLNRIPKHSFNIGAGHKFYDKYSVSADLRYVGERNDFGRMPSYMVVGVGQNYHFDDVSLGLKVGNVLDKEYEEVRSYGTPGRNIFGNVKYVF